MKERTNPLPRLLTYINVGPWREDMHKTDRRTFVKAGLAVGAVGVVQSTGFGRVFAQCPGDRNLSLDRTGRVRGARLGTVLLRHEACLASRRWRHDESSI